MDPTTWDLPFAAVAGILFAIVMLRANATYWLGRGARSGANRVGHNPKSRTARLINSAGYVRAERLINRWGPPVVTFSFLTIGVQTMINFCAGVSRMPLRGYLLAVTLGSVIWALVYATVGVAGLTAFGLLYGRSPALAIGLVVVLVAFVAAFIALRVANRRHLKEQTGHGQANLDSAG